MTSQHMWNKITSLFGDCRRLELQLKKPTLLWNFGLDHRKVSSTKDSQVQLFVILCTGLVTSHEVSGYLVPVFKCAKSREGWKEAFISCLT